MPETVTESEMTSAPGMLYRLSPSVKLFGVVSAGGLIGVEEPSPPQADKESAVAITRESVFALREFMAFPELTKINMIIIR